MKCPRCDGKGKYMREIGGYRPCEYCDGTGEITQTNEEWIHTLNTEQLAELICSVHEKCYYCGAKRVSEREYCPFGDGKCRNNKHEFAMWLKQPHREE